MMRDPGNVSAVSGVRSGERRAYLVTVEMGSPEDGPHRVVARSPSAAKYASFKAWRYAGYGDRFDTEHDAFVWFSRNIVVGVRSAREANADTGHRDSSIPCSGMPDENSLGPLV